MNAENDEYITVICINCDWTASIRIPNGVGLKDLHCEYCGKATLTKHDGPRF